MSGGSLTSGHMRSTSNTSVAFLHTLAGWFQNSEHRHIARKCLEKSESLTDNYTRPLDLHFLLSNKVSTLYKDRDNSPDGLEKAIEACNQHIDFAEDAKVAFEKEYHGQPLPSHAGFHQLAIVLEKQKNTRLRSIWLRKLNRRAGQVIGTNVPNAAQRIWQRKISHLQLNC